MNVLVPRIRIGGTIVIAAHTFALAFASNGTQADLFSVVGVLVVQLPIGEKKT